jgi:hypothetical protein
VVVIYVGKNVRQVGDSEWEFHLGNKKRYTQGPSQYYDVTQSFSQTLCNINYKDIRIQHEKENETGSRLAV